MGVGTPSDLIRAIGAGVDLFDCVMPTRNARNGQAFIRDGRIIIKNARHKNDPAPIEEDCTCAACAGGFSRGYLRHLFVAGEILAHRLLSLHNLHFYGQLIAEARAAIARDAYGDWARERLRRWEGE
jgi:queuine tRNA-ribosyltransferase